LEPNTDSLETIQNVLPILQDKIRSSNPENKRIEKISKALSELLTSQKKKIINPSKIAIKDIKKTIDNLTESLNSQSETVLAGIDALTYNQALLWSKPVIKRDLPSCFKELCPDGQYEYNTEETKFFQGMTSMERVRYINHAWNLEFKNQKIDLLSQGCNKFELNLLVNGKIISPRFLSNHFTNVFCWKHLDIFASVSSKLHIHKITSKGRIIKLKGVDLPKNYIRDSSFNPYCLG